jgi:hypothetical protein
MEEDDKLIAEDFAKIIKGLPLKDKLKGAALFNILEKILKIEKQRNDKNDEAFEKYNNKIAEINSLTDNIVDGKVEIEKSLVEVWKENNDSELVLENADLQPSKIKNFWKHFLLNNELCKLKRPRSSRR